MRSKKAIYNVLSSLMAQMIIIVYGFIVPKIIIKYFGSDVNGLITSITQFLGYITLLESGVGPVIKASLYKPIAKKDSKSIINILGASDRFFKKLALIFLIYLFFLALIYPYFVNQEFGYYYTLSLVVIISISTFAEYYFGIVYRVFLQAEQKTYVISVIQMVSYVFNILFIVILVKLNFSIHIVKLVSSFLFILRPLMQNFYVKKKYDIDLNKADKNYTLKEKWDGLAQHVAAVIHNNTDVVIITLFCNLIEVSVYSVYYLIVKGVKLFVQCFTGGLDASFGDMIANSEYENLNNKFNMYEIIYYTIATIFYICTLILIVPFVKVYTFGIGDADYIRPIFGWLLVLSEFVWAIRLPYSSIVLAAGHFKETKKGAWFEAIVNIVISVILVVKFGIIGVAIGTLIAMLIRTFEFMYYANKYILKRKNIFSVKKIIIIIVETLLIIILSNYLPMIESLSYLTWGINALLVFIITFIIVISLNFVFFKRDFLDLFCILKNIFCKKINF